MPHAFALDRVLETCVRRDAREAWLITGQPPMVRLAEGLRDLDVDPLSPAQVETVLWSDGEREAYRSRGFVDFPLKYGDDYARFHVTAARLGDQCFAVIRRSPKINGAAG